MFSLFSCLLACLLDFLLSRVADEAFYKQPFADVIGYVYVAKLIPFLVLILSTFHLDLMLLLCHKLLCFLHDCKLALWGLTKSWQAGDMTHWLSCRIITSCNSDCIFCIRSVRGKEADSLSKCGLFVILEGFGVGVGSDLLLLLPPLLPPCPRWEGAVSPPGEGGCPGFGASGGSIFYTWVPSKNIGLVAFPLGTRVRNRGGNRFSVVLHIRNCLVASFWCPVPSALQRGPILRLK